jgi:hypothetical protein
MRPHLNGEKKGMVVGTFVLAPVGSIKQGDSRPGWPGQKAEFYLQKKQSKNKKGWNMDQAVECKYEALSSNSSTIQ